jgi:polyhydroxybutyrate depolymerase
VTAVIARLEIPWPHVLPPLLSRGDLHESLSVGGVTRRFILHIPPRYVASRSIPLVVLLHGWLSSAENIEGVTGFDAKADKENFLLAIPEGLGQPQGWNVGFLDLTGAHHPDDVGFIDHMLDRIEGEASVDLDRVFVAGHSNGAMMADLLGARLAPRLAAIAVVAGTIGLGGTRMIPEPSAPVSVLVIHGKRDGMVSYDSGSPALLKGISAPNSACWWAIRDGCRLPPSETVLDNGNVSIQRYTGGRGGTEVELMAIKNGMHDWPGGTTAAGPDHITGVCANDVIWDFFAAHPRGPK